MLRSSKNKKKRIFSNNESYAITKQCINGNYASTVSNTARRLWVMTYKKEIIDIRIWFLTSPNQNSENARCNCKYQLLRGTINTLKATFCGSFFDNFAKSQKLLLLLSTIAFLCAFLYIKCVYFSQLLLYIFEWIEN